MTKKERMAAFSMRCDGMRWADIGEAMQYAPTTVYQDLLYVMKHRPRSRILYPEIAKFISVHYAGSINRFADAMHVSPSRLRRVLIHGDTPPDNLRRKIAKAMNRKEEDIFHVGL